MKTGHAGVVGKVSWWNVETALVFLLFYLWVWLVIDPRLIDHSLGLFTEYSGFSFSAGWPFFQEHLARPGGLVEYVAGFLSQLFGNGWVGAVIVTVAAWSLCRCTALLTHRAGQSRSLVARYVPAAVLLVMYGRYHHPLSTIVSLLVGLSCFAVYVYRAPNGTWQRLLVLLIMVMAAYYVAAAGGLILPILAATYELLIGRRKFVAVAALLCGLGVPWLVGSLWFGFSWSQAYGQFLVTDPGLVRAAGPYGLGLFVFFPLVLAGSVLGRAASARRTARPVDRPAGNRGVRRGGTGWRFLGRSRSGRAAHTALVLASLGAVAWFSRDTAVRTLLEMDDYSQQEKWTHVLEAAERLPRGRCGVRCHRNVSLALYHTGRLGDEMFRYPQFRGTTPFSAPDDGDYGALFQESRMYGYLGQVNYAEKCAHDALGIAGDVPAVLEHLAAISVVQGRMGAAHVLLNALRRNPFHRKTATAMLQRLETDPRFDGDARVPVRASLAPDSDSFTRTIDVEAVLLGLLNNNSQNRMAFEFLMAHYLVTGRPEKVVAHSGRLKALGYRQMPRHYQEALLIRLRPEGAQRHAAPYTIHDDVLREYESFVGILRREREGRAAARAALAAGLGESYFFFLTFGRSGV